MNNARITLKSSLIAIALMAGLGAAQAEGMYGGASLGSPDYRNSVNGIDGKGSGVGAKLYGGYEINPHLAVEAGVFDLGHIDEPAGKVKTYGAFVDAVGSYEFAPKWSLLGRIGAVHAKLDTSAGDDSSPALKLGAGLQYALSPNMQLRAEYEHYRFTNAFDAKPDVGEYTVGLKLGF